MILPAFRVRSFRFQWSADLLTSWAFEMETVVLGWYVVTHTGSVLLLTVFGSLQYVGTLAAPMFGVLGDRHGGRAMLCAMRAIYAALAALLAVFAFAGTLTPEWVLAVAALAGVARPNDLAMRNTLIGATIPAGHLMGALGLSRATADSARVVGALAGATLSSTMSLGHTYLFVAAFYLASLGLTLNVSRVRTEPTGAGREHRADRGHETAAREARHQPAEPRGVDVVDALGDVRQEPVRGRIGGQVDEKRQQDHGEEGWRPRDIREAFPEIPPRAGQ